MRGPGRDAHGHRGDRAQREADLGWLRHLDHTRFRVSLGLLRVFAIGDTNTILTWDIQLGNTHKPAKRRGQQHRAERGGQLSRSPQGETAPFPGTAPVEPAASHRRAGHWRRRHGRIPGRSAPGSRRGGDPGRGREYRLPHKGQPEPLSPVAARQAGHSRRTAPIPVSQ